MPNVSADCDVFKMDQRPISVEGSGESFPRKSLKI